MPTALDAPPRETACTIDWGGLGAPDWDWLFEALPRSTLLQSRSYAEAICPSLGQTARRGLIRIDGAPAGLVQIQEASLMRRALHAVILDRGPLWFDGFGAAAQQAAFWAGFNAAFPRRPGRRRRLIPESTHAPALFAQAGLQAVAGRESYQTIWLDLTPEEDTLRRRLAPKWRNMLSKAERADLAISWDWRGGGLAAFLAEYDADRRARALPGPDPKVLIRLAARFVGDGRLGIGVASVNGVRAASAMVLLHGRSATWQAGWVGDLGRKTAANNLLLWQAMLKLKASGIRDLDLGGVNDAGAAGVKRFKEGLGGALVRLSGQYR